MDWNAGFPERFRFLDDEHAQIGAILDVLKKESGSGEDDPAQVARRLLKKIAEHMAHEEDVMKTHAYPEWELHEKHHQHVIHSIELILQLFNLKGLAEHGAAIARHIENKISEEMFIDRLLAEFLARREAGG